MKHIYKSHIIFFIGGPFSTWALDPCLSKDSGCLLVGTALVETRLHPYKKMIGIDVLEPVSCQIKIVGWREKLMPRFCPGLLCNWKLVGNVKCCWITKAKNHTSRLIRFWIRSSACVPTHCNWFGDIEVGWLSSEQQVLRVIKTLFFSNLLLVDYYPMSSPQHLRQGNG